MRHLLFVATIVLGASSVVTAIMSSRAPTVPGALRVAKDTYDLGVLRQGATAQTSISLRNGSRQRVTIRDIRTSCSCTVLELPKNVLDAGESVEMRVRYSSGTARGSQRSRLLVRYGTDDGPESALTVNIAARIAPDYEYDSPRIIVPSEQGSFRTWNLVPGAMQSVRVLDAYTTHEAFQVASFGKSARDDRWHVTVTLKSGVHPPEIAHLVVHTDSPRQPICKIPLSVANNPVQGD